MSRLCARNKKQTLSVSAGKSKLHRRSPCLLRPEANASACYVCCLLLTSPKVASQAPFYFRVMYQVALHGSARSQVTTSRCRKNAHFHGHMHLSPTRASDFASGLSLPARCYKIHHALTSKYLLTNPLACYPNPPSNSPTHTPSTSAVCLAPSFSANRGCCAPMSFGSSALCPLGWHHWPCQSGATSL